MRPKLLPELEQLLPGPEQLLPGPEQFLPELRNAAFPFVFHAFWAGIPAGIPAIIKAGTEICEILFTGLRTN